MFTGIVEYLGEVESLTITPEGGGLTLRGVEFADDLVLGESVAINGCCLTVVENGAGRVHFDLLKETLRLTNLGDLKPGTAVNLERAMRADARLSGHFVQGHVDTAGTVLVYEKSGQDHQLTISLPEEGKRLVVLKGSITVNGMSLTVAQLESDRFTIWITPHTHAITTLAQTVAGDKVNLEFDMIAKQVERLLALRGL